MWGNIYMRTSWYHLQITLNNSRKYGSVKRDKEYLLLIRLTSTLSSNDNSLSYAMHLWSTKPRLFCFIVKWKFSAFCLRCNFYDVKIIDWTYNIRTLFAVPDQYLNQSWARNDIGLCSNLSFLWRSQWIDFLDNMTTSMEVTCYQFGIRMVKFSIWQTVKLWVHMIHMSFVFVRIESNQSNHRHKSNTQLNYTEKIFLFYSFWATFQDQVLR